MNDYRHILVNKQNKYNEEDYKDQEVVEIWIPISEEEKIPEDIIRVDENGREWVKTFIEKDTYDKLLQLQEIVKEKYGYNVKIIEAGRTYNKQEKYFSNAKDRHGLKYANNYVARGDTSEHRTGRAVDYAVSSDKLNQIQNPIIKKIAYKVSKPAIFHIINKEAAQLGLLRRYPLFKRHKTGYKHERWHLTNIKNPALASFLFETHVTLEEFYEKPEKYMPKYEIYKISFYNQHPELLNVEENKDEKEINDNDEYSI